MKKPTQMAPLLLAALACGGGDREPAAASGPAAVIVAPADGATVPTGPLTVRLDTREIVVRPAGVVEPNTGHHHLFVNRAIVAEGEMIPVGEADVIHLGAAQTEHTFEALAPGAYTVIAVLGDHVHARLAGVRTDTVRFTVR